jgi:hypothetical protein
LRPIAVNARFEDGHSALFGRERHLKVTNLDQQHPARMRIKDLCLLVGTALLVCLLAGVAFLVADIYHVNPLWIIVSLISVGFFAGAREDYRKEFRSVRFVAFVCGWLVVNAAVFILILSFFGWLWLIPVLLLDQFLFYMSAYWLFGLRPPLGPRDQSE